MHVRIFMCVFVYIIYGDTNLRNDIAITLVLQRKCGLCSRN